MTSTQNSHEDWQECHGGEIRTLVGQMHQRRRMQRARTISSVALPLLLIGAVSVYMYSVFHQEMNYGGIHCTEVRESAARYMSGQIDEETRSRIDAHLKECDRCRRRFEEMNRETDRAAITSSEPLLSSLDSRSNAQARR